jgi:hypothetical protein
VSDVFKIGAVLAALTLGSMPIAFADDLTGQASIIDGDTLEIHGTRIRLWGVDATESSQLCRGDDSLQYRCGAQAANDLDGFIASRPVICLPISLDRYGRTVATCSVDGAEGSCSGLANIRRADTTLLNETPNKPGGAYGREAMSSLGCIASASGRAEFQPIARMMRTLILRAGRMCNPRIIFDSAAWRRTLPFAVYLCTLE